MKTSKRKPSDQHPSEQKIALVAPVPTFEQIQKRAFEIYKALGSVSGHDQDDWILAEKELTAEMEIQFRVEQELKEDL